MSTKKILTYVGIGLAVLAALLLIVLVLLKKSDDSCTPNCGNKQCGSNGCGGTCGTCVKGVTCGDDGVCGGAVGPHGGGDDTCNPPCATGSVCVDGHCASSGDTCTKDMINSLSQPDRCNYFISAPGPPMNQNAAAFSCCMSYCGQGCCLWPGCMACGFDASGGVNKDNVYLLFMNQPEKLAQFFMNVSKIDGTYDAWTQNPGTFPMFSNEVGHDWIIDGFNKEGGIATATAPVAQSAQYDGVGIDPTGKYIVYGTPAAPMNPDTSITDAMMKAAGLPLGTQGAYGTSTDGYPTGPKPSKLCGAMKWQAGNGYICGTFDGLGIWKWSQVIEFFCEFSELTGIQEIGLYDAQFLMPHWFAEDGQADLTAAKNRATKLSAKNGAKPVPTQKGGTASDTWELKLHLYLGGWPNFAITKDNSKDHDASQQAQGMWTDICLFCKQNSDLIKYVYIDTDASGLKISANTVQSVPFLTPQKMADLATQLIAAYGNAKDDLVLGAVITANPKYGFLPPKNIGKTDDWNKYLPTSGADSQDQPGGPGDDPNTWSTPGKPSGWDGNNSFCQNTQYPTKDDSTSGPKGCPNSIQNAVFFMSEVNSILKTKSSSNLFTRFIQDGENNGTATAEYCVWWNSILKYMSSILTPDQIKEIKVGQAFSSSTNTGDISKDQNCKGLSQANFVALPELYWYTDYMKNGIGEKYDKSNPNVLNLLELLTEAGRSNPEAENFLKDGAGCEGCDHNHVAIARQTKTMANMMSNLNRAQDYDTSQWLKGAAGPSTTGAGNTACIIPFNTGKAGDTPYDLANCKQTADNGVFEGHYGCSSDCVIGAFEAWLNSDDNKDNTCYFPSNANYCQDGKSGTQDQGAYGQKFCQDQFANFTNTPFFKSRCPEWKPDWNAAWTSKNVECQEDNAGTGKCKCRLTCNPQGMPPGICAAPPPIPIDMPSGI
jgi:hypothetical protein